MYHAIAQVADDPDRLCVSPEQFKAQLLHLRRCGLLGVSVQELLRAMSQGNAKGLIGLTFDDGYYNFLQVALPILERFGFSATVFVVPGMLGGENSWCYKPQLNLLSAKDIREVAERGMEVGSHSMSHLRLSSGLEPELLDHEIVASRETLAKMLDKEIQGFCYPYGNVDNTTAQIVRRAGYAYACGSLLRGLGSGPMNLPRIYVGGRDGAVRLSIKLAAYSQYANIAHLRGARVAYPLVRRFLRRFWFGG
jgi:peptidoglycan/xylan/chitin deacetylase (PgdA/CDA1 family)